MHLAGEAMRFWPLVVSSIFILVIALYRLSETIRELSDVARTEAELREFSEGLLAAHGREEALAVARETVRSTIGAELELRPQGSAAAGQSATLAAVDETEGRRLIG